MSQRSPLSPEQMASAIGYVIRLDRESKVRLADKIFEDQPAVLGAVVQLHSLGVDFSTQEHAYHVLFVLYECFTRHVPGLPKITEATVQAAFDTNSAMLKFYDEETPDEATRLQRIAALRHPEPSVLAFVYGYLAEQFPIYSRENELVINACTAVMAAFVEVKGPAPRREMKSAVPTSATRPKRRRPTRRQRRGR